MLIILLVDYILSHIFCNDEAGFRYYKAIRSCLLHTDMALLPASDDTDLTEINLSTAQKQQITLARAVYARRDINLLDNPLADVIDVNESNQIFEKCCLETMGRKTVIMVSEKIQVSHSSSSYRSGFSPQKAIVFTNSKIEILFEICPETSKGKNPNRKNVAILEIQLLFTVFEQMRYYLCDATRANCRRGNPRGTYQTGWRVHPTSPLVHEEISTEIFQV